ncbi:MAG: arginine--tRNA ligase [Deltaproteobacteria bacterium]|nr:arginine--tRNA ligase [Deltaproteobacteria bacterium]
MKNALKNNVIRAIDQARTKGLLQSMGDIPGLVIEAPRDPSHGDWATNAAMLMAKVEKKAPRKIAEIILANLNDTDGYLERVEIAGPGFINFTLSRKWWEQTLRRIIKQNRDYGRGEHGQGRKVQVEFVSANPTGPLHVGHGRGAAIGDALARLLDAAGFNVQKEYYINNAGKQMQTLGRSVWYRHLELNGKTVDYAPEFYQGEYIKDLAVKLQEQQGEKYLDMDENQAVDQIYPWAADEILDGIKNDLNMFGVTYEEWFSEKSLYQNGLLSATLDDLRRRGHIYDRDGAVWFATSRLGDDKDRVLVKSTGEHTYFATDIAYHQNKYKRGFSLVINLWGADHHGYVPRMKSAVEAMGYGRDQLEVLLVQLVNLLRGGVPVAMSTRAGQFVTLKEVVDEVGVDAARFMFLTRNSDNSLDFDLDVAKRQSADNPVYYVQYAHARICSVFRAALAEGLEMMDPEKIDLSRLKEEEELTIMKLLAAYPELVQGAAISLEPHRLTHYLIELAKNFHPYYNRFRFISDDRDLSLARLVLAGAVRQVVSNGLGLIGVSAPEKM